MIYKDFVESSGIYSAIFAVDGIQDKLPLINDVVTVESLDAKFMYQNSQKEVNEGLIDLDSTVKIILAKYFDKWANYADVLLKENKPLGTITTVNSTMNQKAQTSAMDSAELIDTDGSKSDSETTQTTISQKDRTQYLTTYQRYSIYDMIDTDIRRLLFKNVY